jgi:uncharacterized membrane protein (DUF373 family)
MNQTLSVQPSSADQEAAKAAPMLPPADRLAVPWHQQFRRVQIVQALEAIQDLIAVCLCIGLFSVMVLQLRAIFKALLTTPQFHEVTADILYILILVELFRLLIIYLQEQRVSIGVSVEIAIVSALREVIVKGVLERTGARFWPCVSS